MAKQLAVRWRSPRIRLAGLAALATLAIGSAAIWFVVTGHQQQQAKDAVAFAALDQAIHDINPSQFGQIVVDRKAGTTNPLGEHANRRITMIAQGSADSVKERVLHVLQSAGFETTSVVPGGQRLQDNQLVLVEVVIQGPGGTREGFVGTVEPGQVLLTLNVGWGG